MTPTANQRILLQTDLGLLHPTPALGSQPRTEETLAQLDDWRSRLRCPPHFGAPFGLLLDGDFFCLVGIRSMSWQGRRLALCTGGGGMAGTEAEKGDGQAQLPPALISVPSFPFMRKTGFPGPK